MISPFGPAATTYFDALDAEADSLHAIYTVHRILPRVSRWQRELIGREGVPMDLLNEEFMRLFADRGMRVEVAAVHFGWLRTWLLNRGKK